LRTEHQTRRTTRTNGAAPADCCSTNTEAREHTRPIPPVRWFWCSQHTSPADLRQPSPFGGHRRDAPSGHRTRCWPTAAVARASGSWASLTNRPSRSRGMSCRLLETSVDGVANVYLDFEELGGRPARSSTRDRPRPPVGAGPSTAVTPAMTSPSRESSGDPDSEPPPRMPRLRRR